jgi:hypothetical protein
VRGTLDAHGPQRPAHGDFRGDELLAFGFDELDEVAQRRLRPRQLRAQRPSHCQVLGECIVEGAHRETSAPGHGIATPRSPSRSSFA